MFALAVASLMVALVASQKAMVRMEPGVNHFVSQRWMRETKIGTDNVEVEAVFVMKHCPYQIEKFEKQLLDLSSPKSANYGKWLKQDAIAAQIAPSE
jgi:hypothetical protein